MIYDSLYNSKAYRDLNPISKDIYVGMTSYSKGSYVFNYPYRIYKTRCSKSTFQKVLEDLETHGFIEILSRGTFNHKPNEYSFSDKWQKWKKNNNK